jgi:phospholipid/cholesterol/gamma-HCH transport system permease protein
MVLTRIASVPEAIGRSILSGVEQVGDAVVLFGLSVAWLLRPPFRIRQFLNGLHFVGVGSLFIVTLTGLFAGAVMALQIGQAFRLFNAETMTGPTVALALTRELSPVFTCLMVTARAGSAMATELGTMRVTEQIDALKTMAVNPIHYLVTPRIFASFVMCPILTMFFNLIGMFGCWVVAVKLLGIDHGIFMARTRQLVMPSDISNGLVKAAVFGIVLSTIGCHRGFTAGGGARGVGIATTQAVVYASVLILVFDYFLTVLMY